MSLGTAQKAEPGCSVTDLAVVKEEAESTDEEPSLDGGSEAALLALYAGHVVKEELVLGPELPHRPLIASVSHSSRVSGRGVRLARSDPAGAAHTHDTVPQTTNTDTVQYALETNATTNYVCDTCGRTYQTRFSIIRHFKVHRQKIFDKGNTGRKTYCCEICKKQFARSTSLNVHKRLHTGEKPYSCKICKKAFTQLTHFKRHEGVHTKPYSCEICNMKFATSEQVKVHILLHTGEKPFSCEICKKRFTQFSNLNRHKRIHKREKVEKPFSCFICKKEFTQWSTLKVHIYEVHTGERNPIHVKYVKSSLGIG